MPTVLITGGSGLIGTALSKLLTGKGYDVITLSRKRPSAPPVYHWDPAHAVVDAAAIRQADHIIHLAGAGVADKRWTTRRKQEILDSRTGSSALLVKALQENPNKVKTVISASGIGWYGPDPTIPSEHPFVETDPPDNAFLGETCRLWEAAISPVTNLGKRLVIFRTGVVLSREGGALAAFRKPVKLGVAAILGTGRQVMSWIHVDDLCRLYLTAIEGQSWQGIYNATAPYPASNREVTLSLAGCLKGRYFVPVYVPSFLLKIMVGEMSVEVLKSATVNADKVRQAGFQFNFPSIESAMADLTKKHE